MGSFGKVEIVGSGDRNIYIAALSYQGELCISPPFSVLVPHEDGRVVSWDGTLESLNGLAKAYTRNGFLLERGRFPWGNGDRVFVYSDAVYRNLESFRAERDIEGFYAYCDQCDLVPFAGASR